MQFDRVAGRKCGIRFDAHPVFGNVEQPRLNRLLPRKQGYQSDGPITWFSAALRRAHRILIGACEGYFNPIGGVLQGAHPEKPVPPDRLTPGLARDLSSRMLRSTYRTGPGKC
jgi:hypothetical protein